MGAAESKAIATTGDPIINNNPAALAGIAAAAGADGQAIPPSVTNMGNNASVPSADPNSIPPDQESNTVTVPGLDETTELQPVTDTNDVQPQADTNDLQPVPESELPELPEPQPLSVLLGSQGRTGGKDNRPAFLRRLVTAPSTALAAATHAENVSANALSSIPQQSQAIGAKEHLTKSNSPVTRASPPTDPVEVDGQDTAPASITLPPSRPSTRGSACSVSSLSSAEHDFVPQAQWDSIHGSGGDVSPLDRSAASSPAPGSFNELRRFSRVQGDDEAVATAALSEDDASWRGELLAAGGSEQRLDMAMESLSRVSMPASLCGSAHTGHTFGSFAHPYGFDEDESCDDDVYEIRPEYLPLPDDATDGTADDELSMSVATSNDFDKHYSTGVTSQMSHDLQKKLSSEALGQAAEDEDNELQVNHTESDTECDRTTTVGNVDDLDFSEVHDHVSETKDPIGGLDDAAPLEHDHQEVEEPVLESAVVETEAPIIAQDDNSNESVEQPELDMEAVDEPTPEPKHEEPRHVDAEHPTDKQETDTAETPLKFDKVAASVEALELAGPTEGVEDALTPTSQATEPFKDLKELAPIDDENPISTTDDLAAAPATPTAVATPEEHVTAGSQDISSPMPFDNSDKASVYVPDFPAQEASVIVANVETMEHAGEKTALPGIEDVIQAKPSTPSSSTSEPAALDATEPVSLKDILGESRVPGSPKDIMEPRDDQSGASLDLTSSLPREIIGKQHSNEAPRADSNASLAVQYPADDDGWAIPGRELDEPQSRIPIRNSRRKSLPMLFRDMKDSRKEKSLLPTKKESKDAKKEAKDLKKESKDSKKESKSTSKKDHKPVIATAPVSNSNIPAAPLSAPIAETSRSPFSPNRKSRNVLQRNASTNRPLDQMLVSPTKDKGKKRHGLLGAVFGRSTAAYDLNKEKERERQQEKEKGKEREKEKQKEQKEQKPKKKDSKSKLAMPHRRYSLAGPLGGHDQIAPFAVPRVPTPKRVQEISALLRQDGPSSSVERPRSGSQSLNAVAREGPPSTAADLAAAVSAAVDANRSELQSRVPRPGVIPEPGPEWEEWEQKARQLEGNVPDSPSSQISIPAVLHGPGTPNQAKLYPYAPDSYPFYQYAPPALPPHLQNGPKPYPFGPAPRTSTFDDYSAARQVSGSSVSTGYGSLKRRYSEHYSAASARGLPPFPPHLYGLRDTEYSAPMRQTSQSQLRPTSHAGPSSPSLSGVGLTRKSPEQEMSHLVGESASPCASNTGTADSFEHDLACMPPPVLLPGQTIEAFEMQRAWYEQQMAEEENRRDSGYSAPYGYSPQPGMPFPPHLAAAPYGYPYPPQMYWPHAYPPPPGYPPAAAFYPAAAHTPEDYYHQVLREQHQQELLDPRPGTPTDGGSVRAKSPVVPPSYGYPGFAPAPAAAPYGYPRREMRWRDLTPTEDSLQRAGMLLQAQQQSPASAHKRNDSGIGSSGSGSASQQDEDNNNTNGGPISPLLPAAMQSAGSLLSVPNSNNGSEQQQQGGGMPRRPTVGSMGRSSIRVMETVMEPVELADTDVGLRAGKMQAASYPGMEWSPEGYVEE